jgi:hypothetical protein
MTDVDYIGTPWWATFSGIMSIDYTRSRAPVDYTIDDLIGRKDYKKYRLIADSPTDVTTTSGTILI